MERMASFYFEPFTPRPSLILILSIFPFSLLFFTKSVHFLGYDSIDVNGMGWDSRRRCAWREWFTEYIFIDMYYRAQVIVLDVEITYRALTLSESRIVASSSSFILFPR